MQVLIGTNQLERISGSEVVALEIATYFVNAGADVTVYANWAGAPMSALFGAIGLQIAVDPTVIRPLEFDVVYLQHQVAGLFDYTPSSQDRANTLFAFGRLSSYGLFESGGWAHDEALADVTWANSRKTAHTLRTAGVSSPIQVFHNAAPDSFHCAARPLPAVPSSLLVVTNHAEPSLMELIQLLRSSFTVQHLGRSGDAVSLVTPAMMQQHDVVISIGKTIQYALASRTPAFVYDHFGGPGYLNVATYERAFDRSFSGRCTEVKRTAEALRTEILEGYSAAASFCHSLGDDELLKFRLSHQLELLLSHPPSSNALRREKLTAAGAAINRERLMAEHVRKSFCAMQKRKKKTSR